MVIVPMGRGNQLVNGYVTGFISEEPNDETVYKDVCSVPEPEPMLNRELVELAVWMSEYYLCSCYYILEYMLPKFARSKKQDVAVWKDDSALAMTRMVFLEADAAKLAEEIREQGEITVERRQKAYPHAETLLKELVQAELIGIEQRYLQKGGGKTEAVYDSCIEQDFLQQMYLYRPYQRTTFRDAR